MSPAEYTPEFIARFWSRVDKSGDCWLWTLSRHDFGYGQVVVKRRPRGAHRVAWELTHGPIPEGQSVLHRCDNPPCCNPAHLFLGTDADNAWDKVRKGRAPRGDSHPNRQHPERLKWKDTHAYRVNPNLLGRKLTAADVLAIRARWAAGGVRQNALAAEYGVKPAQVCAIIKRRSWKHL